MRLQAIVEGQEGAELSRSPISKYLLSSGADVYCVGSSMDGDMLSGLHLGTVWHCDASKALAPHAVFHQSSQGDTSYTPVLEAPLMPVSTTNCRRIP